MAYISRKGKILVGKSVWSISKEERAQMLVKEQIAKLDETVNRAYGHKWPTKPGFEDDDILNPSKDETHDACLQFPR
jgi:hypothetical protein